MKSFLKKIFVLSFSFFLTVLISQYFSQDYQIVQAQVPSKYQAMTPLETPYSQLSGYPSSDKVLSHTVSFAFPFMKMDSGGIHINPVMFDINGDGLQDFIRSSQTNISQYVLLNNGGGFTPVYLCEHNQAATPQTYRGDCADFN